MYRFNPEYKQVLWGGRRLHALLDRPRPDGPVGESWELADFGHHHSRAVSRSPTPPSLGDLWRAGALGGSARGDFPFLLKWLDTNDRLSVQVHPDEPTCRRLGQGRPKTEAWFILHHEPGAFIYLGHRRGLTAARLEAAAARGTIDEWLQRITPRRGDMLAVPAGTLHAIGPGFVLLEVQQPSDTTYRVHDWDRVQSDGTRRELHLAQACAAVRYRRARRPRVRRREVHGPGFFMRRLARGRRVPSPGLRVFVATTPAAELRTARAVERLALGDVVVAEPADGEIELRRGGCLWLGEPSAPAGDERRRGPGDARLPP